MKENISKLTTPSGEGANIELKDNIITLDGKLNSLDYIQLRTTSRIMNRSSHAFDLYQQDGSNNWGYQGLQDIMQDPHTGLLYANFGWADENPDNDDPDSDGKSQLHVFKWDNSLKGYKAIASSDKIVKIVSHQGVSLYRPKNTDPVRFFSGTYGAPWVTLRLSSWDYATSTTPVLERTWTLFNSSEFYTYKTSDISGNCRLNVTISPDQKKLAARGRRIADNVYVYRVWDIQKLLDMNDSDATKMYEISVDNPWLDEETDFQSLAFDGYNFYGLYSRGGYTAHIIKVWDILGNIVCERPNSMEGSLENWTQRQFEGETLAFIKNSENIYDLYVVDNFDKLKGVVSIV